MTSYFHKATHLSESQLCPPDENCRICGSKNRTKQFLVQPEPDVWLLECHRCHVSSASRMPTDEALEVYYGKYYSGSTYEQSTSGKVAKITFDKPVRLAKRIRSGITESFQGRQVDILDFGGGDGTVSLLLGTALLEENACKDVRIVLVDLSGEVPHNKESGIVVENRTRLEDDGRHYDVVIASAILEHIPSPREVLRTLLCSLRTGGVFYARTPSQAALLRLLPMRQLRKLLFTYPGHVHDMGQLFWDSILNQLGLLPAFRMLWSRPSPVERNFREGFFRALAAHLLKAPWYVLGGCYGLVGGWEVLIQKCD